MGTTLNEDEVKFLAACERGAVSMVRLTTALCGCREMTPGSALQSAWYIQIDALAQLLFEIAQRKGVTPQEYRAHLEALAKEPAPPA